MVHNNNGNEICDPLYLTPSRIGMYIVIRFKLIGIENYLVLSASIKRALNGRNKLGFIDGTYPRLVNDEPKAEILDKAYTIDLDWTLGVVSEGLYITQVS